jgi:hypothetical protein
MKNIDKLLSSADDALKKNKIVENNNVVEDVYDGYLAGFGPAVITSGIIQTIAVYEADTKHLAVMTAISQVANIRDGGSTETNLLKLCLVNHHNKRKLHDWREKIIDASIALKIMIRTYNLNKN